MSGAKLQLKSDPGRFDPDSGSARGDHREPWRGRQQRIGDLESGDGPAAKKLDIVKKTKIRPCQKMVDKDQNSIIWLTQCLLNIFFTLKYWSVARSSETRKCNDKDDKPIFALL